MKHVVGVIDMPLWSGPVELQWSFCHEAAPFSAQCLPLWYFEFALQQGWTRNIALA
jgi:hypothetical protein